MTRALITGITGQDGSYLAERLVGEGLVVVGVVRPGTPADHPNLAAVADRLALVECDLADLDRLAGVIRDSGADEIYHLGAPTFVPASHDDPQGTHRAVAGATRAVLAAAGGARVFVATSSELFADAGVSPQDEDSPMRPDTPYGEAKLTAHRAVGEARAAGAFAVSGILYNHESPRRPLHFLPRKVTAGVAAIVAGREDHLTLGDLHAVRDWSAATDIVAAAPLALRAAEPRDYVLASGVGRTVSELVATAFAHVGLDWERYVRVDPALVRPPRATTLVGDPTRARTALGWSAQVSFEALIGSIVDADLAAS